MSIRGLWGQPRKNPRWYVDWLDENDVRIDRLSGFEGGTVEVGTQMDFGGNATLNLSNLTQPVDWLKHRARIYHDPGLPGVEPIPVMTCLFNSPKPSHTGAGTSFQVGCITKLGLLRHSPQGSVSVGVNTNIIQKVTALLREAAPSARVAATPSDAVVKAPMFWELGTSYKQICNDLLAAAGYWSVKVDGVGQFVLEPYTDPGARSPAWEFQRDALQLHSDEWTEEKDLSSIPNRVKLLQQGTDEAPGLEAVATLPDSSPYSIVNRGGQVVEVVETVDFATQLIGNQLAQKRLNDLTGDAVGKVSVKHAPLPLLPDDVVVFDGKQARMTASILRMAYQMTPGGLVSGEWREVERYGE